jgi:hypothetical protein
MTMTVRHTDKSLHGDIDQQLRYYILMPEELFFFFVIGTRR